MAVTKYTFSLSEDFTNQKVAFDVFQKEIEVSSMVVGLNRLVALNDVFDVYFDDMLSGADETTLDGIVAAHDGVPYVEFTSIREESLGQSSTTSETWQDKLTLTTTSGITSGEYRLSWSFMLWSGSANKQVEARIYNETDSTVIQEITNVSDSNHRTVYTGFNNITVDDVKIIKIQWRENSTGNISANISDVKLELEET